MKIDTNPSCFFRDKEAWETLRKEIKTEYIEYPKIIKYNSEETIKILCIGCSSGDEAYSISMIMQELNLPYRIDALDINKEKIEIAKKGIYTKESLKNLSPARLKKYFDKLGNSYKIKQELFKINFMQKDAFKYLSETKLYMNMYRERKNHYSIIICRSVFLMHSKAKAQQLLKKINESIFLRGILVLSPDDKMPENIEKYFEVIHFNERIFRLGYNTEIVREEAMNSRNRPIKIIGFGNAGINMVESLQKYIYQEKLKFKDIKIIAASTSICPLAWIRVKNKILYGRNICYGMGSGAHLKVGDIAIKSSMKKIEEVICFKKTKLLILVAGIGGGTGTSALPYVSKLAKENGIKVVSIFAYPLKIERIRYKTAKAYLKKIYSTSDRIIILKPDNICKDSEYHICQFLNLTRDVIANVVVQELLKKTPDHRICELMVTIKEGIANIIYKKRSENKLNKKTRHKRRNKKFCSSCGEQSKYLKCVNREVDECVDEEVDEKIYRCRKCSRKENKKLKKRIENVHELFGCSMEKVN